ncbi:hypothetical protein MNV84_06873 [Leishmania braziliensis]|nr:hypothetical protein MNV84_06873 [Leishmania braziliensis]
MPLVQRAVWHPPPSLLKGHSNALSTGRQPAAIADLFLSCCTSPLCQGSALLVIFKQLSADQQCDILSMALASATSLAESQLDSYVAEVLRNDSFLPTHWVRLVKCLPGNTAPHLLPWTRIAERVLCSSAVPFSSNDDACTFIARVLGCMEDQGIPRNTIAQCLETCGLLYEACAYASSSSKFLPPPPRLAPDGGWGYGDAIHSMCALPEPPMRWFDAARRSMPRVLRHYSTLVLLRSVVQKWGVTDNGYNDRWRSFAEAYMTTLEAASAVHFLFSEGNAVTARVLLPHCHTPQQIATLMRYTCRVDVSLALAALTRSVELRTPHHNLAHVHLTHLTTGQKVHLAFWAQAECCNAERSGCDVSDDTTVEFLSRTLSFGVLDRGMLLRCLREVLPAGALTRGDRSLAHLLASIPASAVEHAVSLLGTVESDALSWWTSLCTEAGNFDGAFALLEAMAARGYLPHMSVLVALLEALRDDCQNFARGVTLLRFSFPQVSDTVLRAYVERTAASITRTSPLALSTKQAIQALSALCLMRAAHRLNSPAAATVAEDTPSTTTPLLALAEVADQLKVPIPLHVGAVEGLIAASSKLGYNVMLSVNVMAATGGCCVSWASIPAQDLESL